jgi:RNA polymerase sigma-70 factor (ECF subfamily)
MGRRTGSDDDGASDEALLSGMAVGDDRAGLTFVRRYQRRLYGLAFGIVGDAGDAEDVAQEAFIRIFRHAPVFDARRGSVATWALTITRNLAIDSIRVRRGIPTDPDDRVFLELTSNERQPDAAAAALEDVARVRSALAALPLDQRRAVVLAALYGRTAAHIADGESIPLGTAKSRIRVGMAKLREAVANEDAV